MKLYIPFLAILLAVFSEGSPDYTRLGCFKDSFIRAMGDKLGDVKSVEDCAELVRLKGYSTFGVQAGRECWSKADAAAKYNTYGPSTGCNNGMGGSFANDVYQFKEGTYIRLGCWKDSYTRSLYKKFGKFKSEVAVRTCADYTRNKGWSVFGVQDGGECWSSDDPNAYKKYGNDSNCNKDGTGASYRNEVYALPLQSCKKCNGKDSCTEIECSADSYCYKLTSEQETAGAKSRVTTAGCVSNCTEGLDKDLCNGKKKCHASCCSYENCNDPKAQDDRPKCYACSKTNVSLADCEANQYELPCSQVPDAQSYCFTAKRDGKHWKGCSSSYGACIVEAAILCSGKSDCSMQCCTGKTCNSSINVTFSGFLILACVLLKFIF